MDQAPDVVVVGAACRDLVDDDERGWRLGGGASYSALALARLGLRRRRARGCRRAGDDLTGAEHDPRCGRGRARDPRQPRPGLHQRRDAHGPHPADAPGLRRGRSAGAPGGVAGRQGLDLRTRGRGDPRRVGGRAAPGCPGRPRLAGPASRASRRGARPPPAARAVTRGSPREPGRGGHRRRGPVRHPGPSRRVHASGGHAPVHGRQSTAARPTGWGSVRTTCAARHWHSIAIDTYVDPVGAGDTFLAAVFAAWVDPSITAGWDGPDPDLRLGAACASLIMEGPGVFGVPYLADAIRRMHGEDNPD